MRCVLGLAATCLSSIGCPLVGDLGTPSRRGDGGALSVSLTVGDNLLTCDRSPCSLDLGLVDFGVVTFEGELRVTAPIDWDPPVADGCDSIQFVLAPADDVVSRAALLVTTLLDEGAACDSTLTLFTNASNQPDDGFVIEVHAVARANPIEEGGDCRRDDLCLDDRAFWCVGAWEVYDCASIGAACAISGSTVDCVAPLGAPCSADGVDEGYGNAAACVAEGVCVLTSDRDPACQDLADASCAAGYAPSGDIDGAYDVVDCASFDATCLDDECVATNCRDPAGLGCGAGSSCFVDDDETARCVAYDELVPGDCREGIAYLDSMAYDDGDWDQLYAECARFGATCVADTCVSTTATCVPGITVCADLECPADGRCDVPPPDTSCHVDGDCGVDRICAFAPTCAECVYAGDGECDDGSATSTSSLCERGTDCADCNDAGQCVPACANDAACANDQWCVDGHCTPPIGATCDDEIDCPGPLVCFTVLNNCEERCTVDDDCELCAERAGGSCTCSLGVCR